MQLASAFPDEESLNRVERRLFEEWSLFRVAGTAGGMEKLKLLKPQKYVTQ